jgi:predicted nucleotidyltransferase
MIDIERIMAILTEICRREQFIVAAYIFGSAASRKMHPASDIDLAILVEYGHEESFPLLAFAALVERECGRPVDLVLLNRVGEVLKHQVRRYGRLIFESNSSKRKAFEIKGRKLYEDFLYLHRRYAGSILYGNTGRTEKSGG